MDKRIQQGLEKLKKEMEKDEKEISEHKNKMISEILKINKDEIIKTTKQKKVSLLTRIFITLGWKKKKGIY